VYRIILVADTKTSLTGGFSELHYVYCFTISHGDCTDERLVSQIYGEAASCGTCLNFQPQYGAGIDSVSIL
jgi:hypothetical protein